jgi:hypothetical protein
MYYWEASNPCGERREAIGQAQVTGRRLMEQKPRDSRITDGGNPMANTEARVNNRETALARRTQDYRLATSARPRSLIGQFFTVLLQPRDYFLALPQVQAGAQWLWMALIMLALAGVVAVRQASLADGGGAASDTPSDIGFDPSIDGGFPPDAGGGFLPDAGFPGGDFAPIETGGTSGADTASNWTTAVIAASSFVLIWGVQAFLLSEVSLFKGRAPLLGQNLRIAIWSTVPLGIMLVLQLLFYAAGGQVGQPGIAGLLAEWEGYAAQSPVVQALLLSLASRLTIFWLWSLILLYFGARYALRGRWWSSVLVVVLWAAFVVLVPVATGQITALETEAPISLDSGIPADGEGEPPFDPARGTPLTDESFESGPPPGADDMKGQAPLAGSMEEEAVLGTGDEIAPLDGQETPNRTTP